MIKKKILTLVLLSSVAGLFAVNNQTPPPYSSKVDYSFAMMVGGVVGAGTTLCLDSNASLTVVARNALIGAMIANGVVELDNAVESPRWLPKVVKKPVLIAAGGIALHLVTRK